MADWTVAIASVLAVAFLAWEVVLFTLGISYEKKDS